MVAVKMTDWRSEKDIRLANSEHPCWWIIGWEQVLGLHDIQGAGSLVLPSYAIDFHVPRSSCNALETKFDVNHVAATPS